MSKDDPDTEPPSEPSPDFPPNPNPPPDPAPPVHHPGPAEGGDTAGILDGTSNTLFARDFGSGARARQQEEEEEEDTGGIVDLDFGAGVVLPKIEQDNVTADAEPEHAVAGPLDAEPEHAAIDVTEEFPFP